LLEAFLKMKVVETIIGKIANTGKSGKLEFLENNGNYLVRIVTPRFHYYSPLMDFNSKIRDEYIDIFKKTIIQEEKDTGYFHGQLEFIFENEDLLDKAIQINLPTK